MLTFFGAGVPEDVNGEEEDGEAEATATHRLTGCAALLHLSTVTELPLEDTRLLCASIMRSLQLSGCRWGDCS